jgi:hypothetical protein
MKLLALILAMFARAAYATTPPPPTPPQHQQQKQAIDMSLMNAPSAYGGTSYGSAANTSMSSGNTYMFPPPAAAAPLPSGLCPQGDSESWSVVWGFVSYAKSSMRTEMECLDKLLAYGRETQPKPVQHVTNYIASPPTVEPVKHTCVPKKKAKPVCKG